MHNVTPQRPFLTWLGHGTSLRAKQAAVIAPSGCWRSVHAWFCAIVSEYIRQKDACLIISQMLGVFRKSPCQASLHKQWDKGCL